MRASSPIDVSYPAATRTQRTSFYVRTVMDWVKSLGRGISAGDKKKLEALEKRMAVLETVPGRVTVLEDDSKELEVNRLLQ